MRIKSVEMTPVDDGKIKAVATVRFANGCEMKDVRVVRAGTEYVVGVPWKRADVRRCVKAGRLADSDRRTIREEVINGYIYLLADDGGGRP